MGGCSCIQYLQSAVITFYLLHSFPSLFLFLQADMGEPSCAASWANSMWLTERWQRLQAADERRRKRNPFSKTRRLPHCLFVFTAVIEVKLHISVRFFYFISLHFIFCSSRWGACMWVYVCMFLCVCICTCSHNNTKRFIECRYRCLCHLQPDCTWPTLFTIAGWPSSCLLCDILVNVDCERRSTMHTNSAWTGRLFA